jgi:hypothetical protein
LVFHYGESTGTIEIKPQSQSEIAKLAVDAPLAAARAALNLQRACWKLVSKMYGMGGAA